MQLTCAICYDDIEATVNIDSCDHKFCIDCITKWAREKTNTCPCCRGKFNVLTDSNGVIIDYFVDKENNDWIAQNILSARLMKMEKFKIFHLIMLLLLLRVYLSLVFPLFFYLFLEMVYLQLNARPH